jgi:hypothetical protein
MSSIGFSEIKPQCRAVTSFWSYTHSLKEVRVSGYIRFASKSLHADSFLVRVRKNLKNLVVGVGVLVDGIGGYVVASIDTPMKNAVFS